jgi:hypothetical protein
MLPRSFVYLVVCGMLSLAMSFAESPDRPACNAVTLGKLFPTQANGNHQLTNKLFNCGELQVCTRGRWRYRWSPLSVRIDQLTKGATSQRAPACAALMQELGKHENPAAEQTASVITGEN